mmetsp:Transcript_24800/g.69538  ORF Transcript_24800/g.69538 Transcript_24800/m.69538 type:complete len:209 (+) Transcript_24800:218-844(+)
MVESNRIKQDSHPGRWGSSSSSKSSSLMLLMSPPALTMSTAALARKRPSRETVSPSPSISFPVASCGGVALKSWLWVHMLKISHWKYIKPKSTATKRERVRRSLGLLHSSVAASSDGTNNASIAMPRSPREYDTAFGLKDTLWNLSPVTMKQQPVTKSKFISIAPSNEDCTTFTSPARIACTDRMISTMFPKVLFSSTPMVGPTMPSN